MTGHSMILGLPLHILRINIGKIEAMHLIHHYTRKLADTWRK